MCHQQDPGIEPPDGVEATATTLPLSSGEAIPLFVAHPPGAPNAPGVVLLVDIYGRSAFYEGLAARLAAAGFFSVVPDPFHREGPLSEPTTEAAFARRAVWDEPRALVDYGEVVDHVRARCGAVGVVGFCLGGTEALLLAADRNDVPTVCFYGFPGGTPAPPGAASLGAPNDRLDDLRGPILGFWGDRDERVGMANVAVLRDGLAQRGAPFEHEVFPGLDHSFLKALDDATAFGHDEARRAWDRAVSFLRQHLVTPVS